MWLPFNAFQPSLDHRAITPVHHCIIPHHYCFTPLLCATIVLCLCSMSLPVYIFPSSRQHSMSLLSSCHHFMPHYATTAFSCLHSTSPPLIHITAIICPFCTPLSCSGHLFFVVGHSLVPRVWILAIFPCLVGTTHLRGALKNAGFLKVKEREMVNVRLLCAIALRHCSTSLLQAAPHLLRQSFSQFLIL